MNVRELIQELQKIENQDTKIVVTSGNFELNGADVEASHIHKFKGKVVTKNCMDAFDYERYTTEVVEFTDEDTDEDFIRIL